jgi:hypothetical protein
MGLSFYNCCWPSSEQSLSDPSPAALITTFYCLRFETPPTWRPGPRIYIPQEEGGAVIPPSTRFPLCRLLRLAGLQLTYLNPPPHGPHRKYLFHYCLFSRCQVYSVSTELFPSNNYCTDACLYSCYLEMILCHSVFHPA